MRVKALNAITIRKVGNDSWLDLRGVDREMVREEVDDWSRLAS